MKTRTTPLFISKLQENEIFVFGSNLSGLHYGGAAFTAQRLYGAKKGIGIGIQGRSYAIPTIKHNISGVLLLDEISIHVRTFVEYAKTQPDKTFLVTEIGCGIAGFVPSEIAALFEKVGVVEVENIHLPASFWNKIKH